MHGGNRNGKVTQEQGLGTIYSRNAGAKVAKALAEAQATDRLSLDGEVDVQRMLALQALRLYELAGENGKTELQAEAAIHLREAINGVSETVLRASRVAAMTEASMREHVAREMAAKVARVIEREVRHRDSHLADKVLEGLVSLGAEGLVAERNEQFL